MTEDMDSIFGMIPELAEFRSNEFPLVYQDKFQRAKADKLADAAPVMSPTAGVKVFDFSISEHLEEFRLLLQQAAWGHCRFDTFNLQYESGTFRAFVAWTVLQQMPAEVVANMKQAAWTVLRRKMTNG